MHVSFSPEVKVHVMVTYAFAYKHSRRGIQWMRFAVDRERFKRRIGDSSPVLSAVLDPEHRKKIYNTRFS